MGTEAPLVLTLTHQLEGLLWALPPNLQARCRPGRTESLARNRRRASRQDSFEALQAEERTPAHRFCGRGCGRGYIFLTACRAMKSDRSFLILRTGRGRWPCRCFPHRCDPVSLAEKHRRAQAR